MNYQLVHNDCFNVFKDIVPKSVHLFLLDLPYNTLQKNERTEWDVEFPLNQMWEAIKPLWAPNSVGVFFGNQPFTSKLILSNEEQYKHCWVWNKKAAGNGVIAKYQPLKIHEDIVVFMNGKTKYYPQMTKGKLRRSGGGKAFGSFGLTPTYNVEKRDTYFPKSILEFSTVNRRKRNHLTEKPVALLEYLIQTYSNEGNLVMDFTMGSGSTGEACIRTNRNFIGIETNNDFFTIAEQRLNDVYSELFNSQGIDQ